MTYTLKFQWNPLSEFLNAAIFVANKEQYIQIFKEVGKELEGLKYIDEMEKELSPFLRRELVFFFGHPKEHNDLGSGPLINKAISNPSPLTVLQGLHAIEQMNEMSLVSQMVRSATKGFFNTFLSDYNWTAIQHDREIMLKLLDQSDVPHNEITSRLQECLKYPEETKQRFCMVLRRFYEIYQSFEKQICLLSQEGSDKYDVLYQKDPKGFIDYYFKLDDAYLEPTTNVHISIFDQLCSVHYTSSFKDKPHHWIFLGIHTDRFLGNKPKREQVDLFLQLLSDKKRIKIIEMLAETPTYTKEISEKLNLTPSAVSYHMGFLFNLNLVTIRKRENRRYYLLDKERMKTYFSLTQSFLLKQ